MSESNNTERKITPAVNLPESWEWRFFDDGSGGLYSPEGKKVVEVDFATSEYRRDGKWHFISGYPHETISQSEFMDSMEKSVRNDLEHERMPDTTAADALKQRLFERLDQNLSDYRDDLLDSSKEDIIDMAEYITARNAALEYLQTSYVFKCGEVDYLLQFEDPLALVATNWPSTLDGLVDMSDVTSDIIEDRESHRHYARVVDETNPGAEKPSVLDRIRAAEKEPKPPRKDKATKDKQEPAH